MIMAVATSPETQAVVRRTWAIGGDKPGAPSFYIVATIDGTKFEGQGTIKQALPPPDGETATLLHGTVAEIVDGGTVTPVINATGQRPMGPVPPVENCKLEMRLDQAFERGTATFSYLDASGKWLGPFTAKVNPA
jgi:Domain of unknown function (DUF1842)